MSLDALIPTTNPHHIIHSGARRLISRDYRRVLGAKVLTTWRRGQCLLEPGVWDHVGVGHEHSLPFWARKQLPVLKKIEIKRKRKNKLGP